MEYPAFVGGDHQYTSRIVDYERTINLMVERTESQGADSKRALLVVPGVTQKAMALSSPGKAHFYENGREFAVSGTSFIEIDINYNITVRGTVAADSNPAQIRSNGDGGGQLLIVAGGNGYSYDVGTNVLTQVAALTGKATMAGFQDGYGLVLNGTSSTFYFSALEDFTSWTTGTDFEQRTKASDPWKALTVNGVYIPILGEHTSEFWYDAGGSSNPFAPDPSGGPIPHGITAPFSLAVGEGSLFWLAQSEIGQRYVVKAAGFTPEVISTFTLQTLMAGYTTVSDAQGEVINWNGHTFYMLSFPTQNVTWAYDVSVGEWFQWGTWKSENNDFSAWRPRWHVVAFGEHRILDSETGAVYKLDGDAHTDVDSRPLVWERQPPAISSENELLFHQSLELAIQPGVGLTTGDAADVDPQVMLQYSNNGGYTWKEEQWRPIGKLGEYETRVIWDRLGSARRRAYRVRGSAAVAIGITGAYIEFSQTPKALRGVRAA